MAPPTKLGSAIGGATKAPASRFMSALSGKRPLRQIVVPFLGVEAALTMVGAERTLDIEGEVVAKMTARGLAQTVLTEGRYDLERAIRFLAEAVREWIPEKGADAPPLGTIEEWGKLPPAVVSELWVAYSDLCEEHDPMNALLADDEIAEIRDAIVKKNASLLRYFGVRKLTAFLLTSADQPASSPTPKSSPGPESQESSLPDQ